MSKEWLTWGCFWTLSQPGNKHKWNRHFFLSIRNNHKPLLLGWWGAGGVFAANFLNQVSFLVYDMNYQHRQLLTPRMP